MLKLVLILVLASFAVLALQKPAKTDATINRQINFQGKIVLSSNSTNITNGNYNMEFKIYSGGDGVVGGGDETLLWTEDHLVGGTPVTITDGVFQVNLGSITSLPGSVDFNNSTIWLSMQLGNTSSCTIITNFNTNCSGDGEMSPMVRFTAAPYAFNSDTLDGIDSAAFGQLSANNTWTGTQTLQPTTNITSAIVKQTSVGSPTADIFNIQTANSTNILQVTGPAANEAAVTLKSIGATRDLTLDSGSGTLKLGSNTTTLQKSGTAFTFDVNSGSNSTLTVTNAGGGIASVNVEGNITASGGTVTLGDNSSQAGSLIVFDGSGNTSVTLTASGVGTSYSLTLPTAVGGTSQCLQTDSVTNTQLVFAACSVGGSGDNITVNGATATDANFIDTTATTTVAGTTFTLATGPNPDTIALTIGNADGTHAGALSASIQTIGGDKTISGNTIFNGTSTFNTDTDFIFSGTENLALTSDLAGSVDVLSVVATPSSSAGTTQGLLIQQANSANTNGLDNGITINNADTDLAITAAIKIQNGGGGGYTTIIDNQGTLISGTELNLLDGHTVALVDTGYTGTLGIVGTGVLDAGSITSNFGAINVGADNITTTGTVFGNTLDRSTAGQLSIGTGGASAATSIVQGSASVTGFTFTTDDNAANDFAFTGGATFNNSTTTTGTATFNGTSTFNTDTDLVFSSTENLSVTSDLSGTVDVLSVIATPSSSAGTTQGLLIQQANSANTNGLDNGITINNADTNLAITAAIKLSSSGGGFTNVIDNQGTLISGAELNLLDGHSVALVDTGYTGTLGITGTGVLDAGSITSNFGAIDVGADNITTTGTVSGNTLDRTTSGTLSIGTGQASAITLGGASTVTTAAGGLTVTGTTLINNSGTASTTIGNSSGGTITIGATSGSNLVLQDAQWGITGAGAASLVSVDSGSGTIQTTGASYANDFDRSASGTLTFGNTNASTINIGTNAATHTIGIGTGAAVQTITIGSSNSTSITSVLGGAITTTNNQAGVIIGGGYSSSDTTLVGLTLDSSSTFAETANTCTASVNGGSLYYNSTTNAVRGCINGQWEDMVSTASLGLQLFGVVPDSGANPGDLASVTGAQNGPCKVSVGASTSTLSWTACTAFSGGRKILVTASTQAVTTTNGNWQHLCLTGTNNQPTLSTSNAAETANLSTVSMPSVTSPILCLADIKTSATAITVVYDTRTYTTAEKQTFSIGTTAPTLGMLVTATATKGVAIPNTTLNGNKLMGVIVATTGATSTTTINAIIVTGGPASVKSITGTNGISDYILGSATAGYAVTNTAKPAELTTTIFNVLGVARNAWTGGTACAINSDACAGSLLTTIDKR